jgi:glutamate/aspartate transport system permease protein
MHYSWDWLIFFKPSVTGEGLYGLMLLRGLLWTVALSLLAWTLALGLGLIAGVSRTLPNRAARYLSTVYIHCFRNTPLLVQLFLWYFVVPELLPLEWGNALKQMNPTTNQFLTVLVGLTLYTAAKAAEQVRAGIESVPRSQKQAAMALGLGLPPCDPAAGPSHRHPTADLGLPERVQELGRRAHDRTHGADRADAPAQ